MKRTILYIVLPFIFGALVYGNTASYEFVYDDIIFQDVPQYRFLTSIPEAFRMPFEFKNQISGLYRPITISTFILNFALFGESPYSFHMINILLHGVICSLLFVVCVYVWKFDPTRSELVAILFAVLPIHTEVVANIKSRDELLAMMFFLGMWITYALGRKKQWWYGMSGLCFFLGLLSKESALWFPVVVLLWSYAKDHTGWKKILILTGIYTGMVVLYLGMRSMVPGGALVYQTFAAYITNPLVHTSLPVRIFSGLGILNTYLIATVFPIALSATYHYAHFVPITDPLHSLNWIAGAFECILLITLAIAHSKKKDAIWLGSALFGILYIPMSQILPFADVISERKLYVPSIGLILIGVFLIPRISKRWHMVMVVGVSTIVSAYAIRTVSRNAVWQTNMTLYSSMVHDAPLSAKGHEALARDFVSKRDFDKAALEANVAAKIYSDTNSLHNLFALIAIGKGDYDAAEHILESTENLRSSLQESERLRAVVYYLKKEYQTAYDVLSPVMKNPFPNTFQENFTYIAILVKLKKYDEAQQRLSALPDKEKRITQMRYLQSILYYKTGKKLDALKIDWDPKLTQQQEQEALEEF